MASKNEVDPEWRGHFENLEHLLDNESEPSGVLATATKLLRGIHESTNGWNAETTTHFVQTTLKELVKIVLSRVDIGQSAQTLQAVEAFLQELLLVIVADLKTDTLQLHLLEVLGWLFDSKRSFYRACGVRQRPLPSPGSNKQATENTDNNETAEIGKDEPTQLQFARSGLWSVSSYMLNCVEFFGQQGGFDVIRERITSTTAPQTPYTLRFLLYPLTLVREIVPVAYFSQLTNTITTHLTSRLLQMPNDELKKIDKQDVDALVQDLEIVQRQNGETVEVTKFFDEFRLDYALKCFISPILEKRLLGLADIKKACDNVLEKESAAAASAGSSAAAHHRAALSRACWLTSEHLCTWIRKNEIMQWLYGRSIHIELVRRSLDILKFLAATNNLSADDLQIVWDSANNQHESLVRVVRQSVADLCPSLSLEQLNLVSALSRTIPFSLYNHQIIALLRSCTIQAVLKSASLPLDQRKFYGLPIMWEMLQDSSKASSDNLFQALHFMFDFLSWAECQSERIKYLKLCVENLKHSRSQAQSLKVMLKVIGSFAADKATETQESVIDRLNREDQLLDAFINDLPIWKNLSREAAVKQFPDFDPSNPPLPAAAATLTGRYSHQENIRDRIAFLTYLCSHSSLALSSEQLQVFWECFILNSLSATEQDEAFLWLEQAKQPSKTFSCFSDEAALDLFSQNVPRLDFAALRTRGFSFLKFYFVWTNVQGKRIDRLIDAAGNFTVLSFDLIGTNCLWEAAFSARDQAVGVAASNFLLELHKHLAPELKAHVFEHREAYLVTCIDQLRQARNAAGENTAITAKQHLRIKRALLMIKGLIDQFEPTAAAGRNAHQLTAVLAPVTNLLLTVKHVQTQLSFQESFPSSATLQDLIDRACRQWEVLDGAQQSSVSGVRAVYASRELTDKTATLLDLNIRNKGLINLTTKPDGHKAQAGGSASQASGTDEGYAVSRCSSTYFNELFALLTLDQKVASDIWALLMKLPTNPAIYSQLKTGGNWESLLTLDSVYSLLYSLQVVSKLSTPTTYDSPEDLHLKTEWSNNFVRSGGVAHLIRLLCQIQPDFPFDSKYNDTVALLLKITNSFILVADEGEGALPSLKQEAGPFDFTGVPARLSVLLQHRARSSSVLVGDSRSLSFTASSSTTTTAPTGRPAVPVTPPSKTQQGVFNLIFQEGTSLFVAILLSNPTLLRDFAEGEELEAWLNDTLLQCCSASARSHIKRGLSLLSKSSLQAAAASSSTGTPIHQLLFQKLISFLQSMRTNHDIPTSQHYFELIEDILNQVRESVGTLPDLGTLLSDLTVMITQHPVIEKHHDTSTYDQVFIGSNNLVSCLLRMGVSSEEVVSVLLPYLYTECLFRIPSKTDHGPLSPPTAKTSSARHAAFQCLLEIGRSSETAKATLFDLIEAQMQAVLKRDRRRSIFSYDPSEFDRAECGFVGLLNQGATCYMNSLMQQFFMIPQFRYSILSLVDTDENKAESLLWQFQLLLSTLLASERKFYDTRPFFGAYKDNGEAVNTSLQMDADEFFNMFLDKLEWAIKNSPDANCIQDIFGGKLIHQIISKECAHTSSREENFMTLSLEVKNKKSITESLELFIKPDILDGENKYHCAECNAQVAAQKRVCVGTLPNCLIVHLKRFEFDFETFQRRKVNDICEFGNTLNMSPFTLAGLQKAEEQASEKSDAGASASSSQSTASTATNTGANAPEVNLDDEYELSGIVVHTGTTEAGHYYSYIRNREANAENQWLSFNDRAVESFNPANISSHTFGGTELHTFYDKLTHKEISRQFPKSYSAYILFYERKRPNENWTKRPAKLPRDEAEKLIPAPIYDQIWADNTIFFEDKHLFDHAGYTNFIVNLCKSGSSPVSTQVLRTATYFLCEVMLYAKQKDLVHEFCEFLAAQYAQNLQACHWFFETLVSHKNYWLVQFCLSCPLPETREEFASLVIHVMHALRPSEQDVLTSELLWEPIELVTSAPSGEDGAVATTAEGKSKAKASDWLSPFSLRFPPSKSLVLQLMDTLLVTLRLAQFSWRNFDHYFLLFVEFARMGEAERQWLNKRNTIACMIDFYLGTDSPYIAHREDPRTYDLGDKTNPPAVEQLVELVSILSRRFPTDAALRLESVTPYQIQDGTPSYELSDFDLEMLRQPSYYTKALSQNVKNVEAVIDTALHLCWGDADFSKRLINEVLHSFCVTSHSKQQPFYTFFLAYFSIHDDSTEWRIDYGLSSFVRVIDAILKLPFSSPPAIRFLANLAKINADVSNWLFVHRDTWMENWLIVSHIAEAREATEQLIMALAPTVVLASVQQQQQQQQQGGAGSNDVVEAVAGPSDKDRQRLLYIRSLLLQLMSTCLSYTSGIPPEDAMPEYGYPSSFFHLSAYFRLLRWSIHTAEDVELFSEYWDKFVLLFVRIDTHRYEGDENKKELIIFWVHVLNIAPARIIDLTVTTHDSKEQVLIAHVSLPGQHGHLTDRLNSFNFETLPYYYHLLYRLAAGNESFLATCHNHPNVEWAFTSFYLSSDYPNVATALFDLISLIAERFPEYRSAAIPRALSRGIAHTNIILLLEALVQSKDDLKTFRVVDGMTHLSQFVIHQQQYLETVSSIPALVKGSCQAIDRALSLLYRAATALPLDEEVLDTFWDHGIRVNLLFALLPLLDQDDLLSRSDALWKIVILLSESDPTLSLGQAVQCIHKNYQDGKPLPFGVWAVQLCRMGLQEDDVFEAPSLLASVARTHPQDSAELLHSTLSNPEFLSRFSGLFVSAFLHFIDQLELLDNDSILESCRLLLPYLVPEQVNAIGDIAAARMQSIVSKLRGSQEHSPNTRAVILIQVGLDLIRLVKFVNMLVASNETSLAALPILTPLNDLLPLLQVPEIANFYESFEHCISFREGVAVLSRLPATLVANLGD